jgi:ribonucleoside-diphosphate reductase alpha chain
MFGRTYKVKTGYGNLYITINNDENGVPFEVFATIGKSGGFFQEQSEAICRLISLALRAGIRTEDVIRNIRGIRGPMPMLTNKGTVLSLPDAIGQILEEHVSGIPAEDLNPPLLHTETLEEVMVVDQKKETATVYKKKSIADYGSMPGCPDCGAALQLAEGCMSCRSCGFSRCM